MRFRHALLLALFGLPLLSGLNDSTVWDANEAFYAQTPREMLSTGNWLVPHFNGEPRLNKPPLSYWVVGLLYSVFGVSLWVERLVMAMASLLSLVSLFFLARLLADERVALLATGIFATTFRFLILSKRLLIDTLMLGLALAGMALMLKGLRQDKPAYFWLSAIFFGLAFLTKGPVAWLPLVALLVYLLLFEPGILSEAPWKSAACILLLVSSSWFLALLLTLGWQPVVDFFVTENVGRLVSVDFGPRRGYSYYLGVLLADFFPWSLFFIAGLWWWIRRGRVSQGVLTRNLKKSFWLLLLWISLYLLLFSFSYNKQEYYIVPLYPAAAIWVAIYSSRASVPALLRVLAAGLLLLLAIFVAWLAPLLLAPAPWLWIPPIGLMMAAVTLVRKRYLVTILSLTFFYTTAFALYLEPFERYKPVRPLARSMVETARSQGHLANYQAGYFRFTAPSLRYYLDRDILEIYELEEALQALHSSRPTYLIAEEPEVELLRRRLGHRLEIVDVEPKLYTTARTLFQGIRSGRFDDLPNFWTRPVYLVSNRGSP